MVYRPVWNEVFQPDVQLRSLRKDQGVEGSKLGGSFGPPVISPPTKKQRGLEFGGAAPLGAP